uniref:Iron ABC transporter permease n=1 Tax=Agrobacterium rosae TaxID=1972867 RepID=A0AAW9FTM0_9HYPH|nr:iron ABC transporter permease [Agrobacterium rosae]MDX8305889.1 iron ABC transporter permease [Agrobacterium rosae]
MRPPFFDFNRLSTRLFWTAGVALLLLLAILQLRLGSRLVGWSDVFLSPTRPQTLAQAILETTRAPRLVAAILTGAALALAGSVLQSVLRNPLAAPDILSVTSGAQLFLVVSTLMLPFALPPIIATGGGGLVGAVACLALAGGFRAPPGRLALSGVAISLCFSALSSAVVLLADDRASGLLLWSSGILDQTNWSKVVSTTPIILLSSLSLIAMGRSLDLLGLGDQASASLGVTRTVTVAGLFASVLLCGSAVTIAGPIGFIGLAVPNALRALGVTQHARHLPLSMLWGANTLLLADVITQAVASNDTTIPTGVTVACLGAPIMLILLQTTKNAGERRFGLPIGSERLPLPLVAAALAAACVTVAAGGLLIGDGLSLTLAETVTTFELRAPRQLVALACGALLAAAGTVLQAVTRNPLCGPETLGLTQGAALFSLIALLLGFLPATPTFQIIAFAGSLTVVLLLRFLGPKNSPEKFVLTGVAVAASLGAAATIIVIEARLQTAQALSWLIGSTHARGYDDVLMVLPWVSLLLIIGVLCSRHLDIFALGDDKARSLGLKTGQASFYAMIYAAVAVSAAVSAIGAISFVGLLAPHAARLLTGSRHNRSLPVAMTVGALLLALADTVGRGIIAPFEFPAGIITAIVGTPALILLLRKSGNQRS